MNVARTARGSVLAIKAQLDRWALSASMRDWPEMLKAPPPIAAFEVQRLQKAVGQMQTLCSEAKRLIDEVFELRETFTHNLRLVRSALALNDAEKSNVTSIDSVTKRRKPPLSARKRRLQS